jgi:lysozyme
MQISPPAIEYLVKQFEGCKLTAYRCPAGVCTIGYGHTSAAGAPAVQDGMKITQQQANDILHRDLVKYEIAVQGMLHELLEQHQFDVLVSFAYNAGVGNLKSSTLLKKVNAAQFDEVPAELMKWTRGDGKILPGLVRRRHAEGAWWIAGDAKAKSAPENEPVHYENEQRAVADPVPVRTMASSKQGNAALVTAGLGGLGIAKEVVAQAKDASDTADQLVGLFGNTNFLIMSAIISLAAAIWFFRRQNMEKYGV